jgi:hypothetical protein
MPPPFELAAVGLQMVVAGGRSRERRADNYAAAALGKNLISTGWVRRMSIADGQCLLWWMCYLAVAVGGVAQGAWEQQASIWSFLGGIFLYFRFSSSIELGTSLCIYVDCTKCLSPPNRKSAGRMGSYQYMYSLGTWKERTQSKVHLPNYKPSTASIGNPICR